MELFKVISETAGTIFRIEKNAGDTIDEGDVILILESMKMENTYDWPGPLLKTTMAADPTTNHP